MINEISALASHSALDIFDGAKDEGFRTTALCKKGRDRPYREFSRIVDRCLVLEDFKEIASEKTLSIIRDSILVPNRSLAVYLGYDSLERIPVKVFGNRKMLRWEERKGEKNYYKLLDKGSIRRPKTFRLGDSIDIPVIAKLPEASRRVERGFFIASNQRDFDQKISELEREGVIDKSSIEEMVIEEFVFGAHFNVNFFYSVLMERTEIISIDRRIQTDLDGFLHMPAKTQMMISREPRMIEVGHQPVTMRESVLEKIFEIGYSFVEATRELEPPGIVGPFTLQLMVTPSLEPVVFDVAPRIGGGTNAFMGVGSQYSKLYFNKPVSLGRRIAMEIREAINKGVEDKVTS